MDANRLRAWWWQRQGLDGSLAGKSAAEVLDRAGWARSVGGANPYLTLFARSGLKRAAAEAAAAALEIHELPSARGCTYVVPATDFALALTVGQAFGGGEMRVARKLGATDKDIDRLCETVLAALSKAPMDPEELKAAVGPAVKSFGEEGKKKGLTSTLPVALGRLQQSGDIRRVPASGRLDLQRYTYALWRPNPLAKTKMSAGPRYVELARRYFQWAAPARPADFQWFSGLGVKAAKAAIEPLGLVAVEAGSELLIDREGPRRVHPDEGARQAAVRPGRVHRQHQPAPARFAEPRRRRRPEADGGGRARRARTGRFGGPAEPRDPGPRPAGRPLGIRCRHAADCVVGVRRGPEGQGAGGSG